METIADAATTVTTLPDSTLIIIVSLAGLALAAYAIYVVHQVTRPKGKR